MWCKILPVAVGLLLVACESSSSDDGSRGGADSGTEASAGQGGNAGQGGSGGQAGNAGQGGSSGQAGAAGLGGSAGQGTGGSAGEGAGGGGGAEPQGSCNEVDPQAKPPVVFWPKPVRAYPGIPFTYTMVAYDEDGLELCYDVEGAPVGLSINGKGDISWAPTEADTGKHEFTVHITTPQGGRKSVEVSLEVTKNGFVFAELGGHDGAAGTIDDPFGTIEKGLAALKPSGAKTLIIRGGTWLVNWKWEAGGVSAPTRDARFSAAEPGEIYGYPGEKVIIQRDQKSHGLWLYRSQYVIARDVEFRGANVGERGGAETSGENLVFQRVTVRDSDWNAADNCSGFKLRGVEIVAHRCAAHDNYERKKLGVAWNNANYLMYADDTPPPLVYAIDCDSSGSVAAYKIKHAGPGKFIVHGVRDNGSFYGFGGIDDGLRVRYSTFVDNHIGIHLGISDPNSHTAAGDVVVEHNTVVHPKETAITLQNSYVPTTPIHVERNIFVVNQPFALPEESQWMYAIWIYTEKPSLDNLIFGENCLWAPEDNSGFRIGKKMYGWSEWVGMGKDTTSVWGEPGFVGAGDYRLQAGSACRLEGGIVAGAYGGE